MGILKIKICTLSAALRKLTLFLPTFYLALTLYDDPLSLGLGLSLGLTRGLHRRRDRTQLHQLTALQLGFLLIGQLLSLQMAPCNLLRPDGLVPRSGLYGAAARLF